MGKIVSASVQKDAAEAIVDSISEVEGVDAEVVVRSNGTHPRNVVAVSYTHLTLPTKRIV